MHSLRRTYGNRVAGAKNLAFGERKYVSDMFGGIPFRTTWLNGTIILYVIKQISPAAFAGLAVGYTKNLSVALESQCCSRNSQYCSRNSQCCSHNSQCCSRNSLCCSHIHPPLPQSRASTLPLTRNPIDKPPPNTSTPHCPSLAPSLPTSQHPLTLLTTAEARYLAPEEQHYSETGGLVRAVLELERGRDGISI